MIILSPLSVLYDHQLILH